MDFDPKAGCLSLTALGGLTAGEPLRLPEHCGIGNVALLSKLGRCPYSDPSTGSMESVNSVSSVSSTGLEQADDVVRLPMALLTQAAASIRAQAGLISDPAPLGLTGQEMEGGEEGLQGPPEPGMGLGEARRALLGLFQCLEEFHLLRRTHVFAPSPRLLTCVRVCALSFTQASQVWQDLSQQPVVYNNMNQSEAALRVSLNEILAKLGVLAEVELRASAILGACIQDREHRLLVANNHLKSMILKLAPIRVKLLKAVLQERADILKDNKAWALTWHVSSGGEDPGQSP